MKQLCSFVMFTMAVAFVSRVSRAADFPVFVSDEAADEWLKQNSETYANLARAIKARTDIRGYRFHTRADVPRGMVLLSEGYIEVQLNDKLTGADRTTTLIFEMANGARHRDHQQIDGALAAGVIESAEAYALARELIEFEALRTHARILKEIDASAGPLPAHFFYYAHPPAETAQQYQPPNLADYLRAQKETGHTAFYHKQYELYRAAQAAVPIEGAKVEP